ncbi:MAG: hypothetical protein XXXJIFNMEKO3_02658 [Candidatus Erwinia impunctatus]|nr:hypothetical protein XXXJIFNMEKO_02658 [Culicoides impunctatus]
MVIKVNQEQLNSISQDESKRYINELYSLIIRCSPSLKEDPELMKRLSDANEFVESNSFSNKSVITDFLITNAYEPYFYEVSEIKKWLLKGRESVECEYIKYQQIKNHLISRTPGDGV